MHHDREDILQLSQAHFLGNAKIRFHQLTFRNSTLNSRRIVDENNVTRLRGVFEREGCQRLYPEYRIRALIGPSTLADILQQVSLTASEFASLSEPPLLPLSEGFQITCEGGLHRVEAAKPFFDVLDQWWIVSFYDDSRSL